MTRRWHPAGTMTLYRLPAVGDLIALDHAVYRVRGIEPRPEDLWGDEGRKWVKLYGNRGTPVVVVVRPACLTGDDVKLRGKDRHILACARMEWHVYPDEHYPVCAKCGEPTPCRESEAIKESKQAAEVMARYEIAGVCPACQEPVTDRQASRTFDVNFYMPGGPPVTFHSGRQECWSGMVEYETQWVAADPARRKPIYRCDGVLTIHTETTFECSKGIDCPGPQASHKALSGCDCDDHVVYKSFRLAKDAVNLALVPRGGAS